MFSKKVAGIVLICSLVFLLSYHVLVLVGIIPSDTVWGGNLPDDSSLYVMEGIAFVVTGFFMFIAFLRSGLLERRILPRFAKVVNWIMIVYFSLNVLGNFAAQTLTEKLIFIPLSIIMVICSIRLVLKDRVEEVVKDLE